jgi:hypothetical protein
MTRQWETSAAEIAAALGGRREGRSWRWPMPATWRVQPDAERRRCRAGARDVTLPSFGAASKRRAGLEALDVPAQRRGRRDVQVIIETIGSTPVEDFRTAMMAVGAQQYAVEHDNRLETVFVVMRIEQPQLLAAVDPDTLEIREYALPHAEGRPRRIATTSDDVIWYSDYARGALGRFDPKTGDAREWPSSGGLEAGPYGIATLNDILWYSESGIQPNTLVRFDPETETFETWPIPSGGGVVRNMMPTSDGSLVVACSGVNRIALVEVKRR